MLATAVGPETRIRTLAEQVTSRAGYELVDVEYRRESDGWKDRLFINKTGGVNLDDCQRISHEFGTLLEVEDPIPHRYSLEVSSPGLNRPLKQAADFGGVVGKRVRVVTRELLEGQRNYAGRLISAAPDESADGGLLLTLRDDTDAEHVFPVGLIERARVEYEWPDTGTDKSGSTRPVRKGSGKRSGRRR